MAIDFLKDTSDVLSLYLVHRLVEEAGVCIDPPEPGIDEGRIGYAELDGAIWERGKGLCVQDGKGQWFRLRVTAEAISDPLGSPSDLPDNPISPF